MPVRFRAAAQVPPLGRAVARTRRLVFSGGRPFQVSHAHPCPVSRVFRSPQGTGRGRREDRQVPEVREYRRRPALREPLRWWTSRKNKSRRYAEPPTKSGKKPARAAAEPDHEDERPRRKKRRRDDDDEEAAPRSGKPEGNKPLTLVLAGVGLLVLVGAGAAIMLSRS